MTDAANHPFLTLFSELLAVPSPSGREERMAECVCAHLDRIGCAHRTDPAGNVIATVEGGDADAAPIALAAHMDEIGLTVRAVEADGSLRVVPSGGLQPHKLGESPVQIIGDGEPLAGLLSFGAQHGSAKDSVTWDDARILTGLKPEALAEAGVRIGSAAVPWAEGRGPVLLGDAENPLVAAWTFDDRAGVVTLLRLLEAMAGEGVAPLRTLLVCFTVHEEGGCHGAKVLCQRERPEIFLAVDNCPISDRTGAVLDARPALWTRDSKTHYDQRLVRELLESGRAAGQEVQVTLQEGAYSDASAVYNVGAAPRVGIIGVARENSHGFEAACLAAFDNLLAVLTEYVRGA